MIIRTRTYEYVFLQPHGFETLVRREERKRRQEETFEQEVQISHLATSIIA